MGEHNERIKNLAEDIMLAKANLLPKFLNDENRKEAEGIMRSCFELAELFVKIEEERS